MDIDSQYVDPPPLRLPGTQRPAAEIAGSWQPFQRLPPLQVPVTKGSVLYGEAIPTEWLIVVQGTFLTFCSMLDQLYWATLAPESPRRSSQAV